MICRMPNKLGEMCGTQTRKEKSLKFQVHGNYLALTNVEVGDYVRHLIEFHWDQLVEVHNAMIEEGK